MRTFDLNDPAFGDPRCDDPPDPVVVGPGRGEEHVAAPSRARRARRVAAAAVVGVLLTGWFAVSDVIGERDRSADVVAAPGGLRQLDAAPGRLWSRDVEATYFANQWPPVQVVDGTVVTLGDRLTGLDARTGAVLWRAAKPEPTGECRGAGDRGDRGPLYCYTYVPSSGTLWSREPAGYTAFDPATGDVVARRDVPEGTRAVVGSADLRVAMAHRAGRSAVLTLADARTGATLWSRAVPYDADLGFAAENELGLSVFLGSGVVGVFGPGVQAAFTLDGGEARGAGALGEDGYRVPFPTDDGTAWGGVLVVDGGGLVMVDARTERVWWRMTRFPDAVLARVGSTGFFQVGRELRAVDLLSGGEVWSREMDEGVVGRALTDGRSVILAVGLGGARPALVALSATDGAPRWRMPLTRRTTTVEAAHGVLVVVQGRRVSAYG